MFKGAFGAQSVSRAPWDGNGGVGLAVTAVRRSQLQRRRPRGRRSGQGDCRIGVLGGLEQMFMFAYPFLIESVMCWQCFMQGILVESIPRYHVSSHICLYVYVYLHQFISGRNHIGPFD